ncbi:hypothetical protein DL766_003252 [Monosporascus sp. MC13-8B]|nr:hypothetical protein DL763_000028 [Monosporascus cannonballus]RYP33883.1 hypothetical protein DL766_003252 [Monosporascus sp. MC13-8B]
MAHPSTAARPHLFWRQTWALVRKNFLIVVARSWLSTLIRSLILPIALLVVLLEIQNFMSTGNVYGFGSPNKIPSLADSVDDKKLVFVNSPELGPDFPPIFEKIVGPLGADAVLQLRNEGEIERTCPVDYNGNSPCHAVVLFNDSPLSDRPGALWNYTIRTDPIYLRGAYNPFGTEGAIEDLFLPLQIAIENAITNSTTTPDLLKYTYRFGSQEEAEAVERDVFLEVCLYILTFVFFMTMMPVAHHVAGMVAGERESGMSDLIDAMGGGVTTPRVLSYVISFYILYLPLWIMLGSVTSWSIFGAAFFKRSSIAAIAVPLICLLLAALAAYQENLQVPPVFAQTASLGFLFPSMNYVFFLGFLLKSELAGRPVRMHVPIPTEDLDIAIPGQATGSNWVNRTGPYFLFIFLAVQIIGYPLLAILVEHYLHGNNSRHRRFNANPGEDHVAVQTADLKKHYYPGFFERWFCCSRKPVVKAVDGLDLVSQKNQILCLLGPNGSGKTTTLGMLAGFEAPTGGSIQINALPSQLGICPQRNVLFDNLTVYEHLVIWNTLKGNLEDEASLESLIEGCDLRLKRNSLSRNLSGGMKRKLQLACMLVGGSSICLLDEVTSGLDPLSRRVIWNAILRERSHRTMILTTHFLDESEVLSDHIAILSLGKTKCQGTPAELKNQYGGGYRVHIPKSEDLSRIQYPVVEKRDRYVCTTPDSASAAALLATLESFDDSELSVTGPTVEDVFLKVSDEPHGTADDKLEETSTEEAAPIQWTTPTTAPSGVSLFLNQVRALMLKRFIILRSAWWAYFFAMGIPVVTVAFLGSFLEKYEVPTCNNLLQYEPYDLQLSQYPVSMALGPQSANESVMDVIDTTYSGSYIALNDLYVLNSREGFVDFVRDNADNLFNGGLWMDNDSAPIVAVPVDAFGPQIAMTLLNLMNQAQSGVNITTYRAQLMSYSQAAMGNSMIWVSVFCLLMALYPAFFALYPTYERKSQVRALQYSNGIRPFPLLLSYMMFDFIFVLVVSILCTLLISSQAPWFGLGYLFLVQALYGMASILFAYLISLMTRSQPAAFASAVLAMAVMYILAVTAFQMTQTSLTGNLTAQNGLTFGLGLLFPIQNLLTGVAMGLNTYTVRCRGLEMISDPGSIYAYGGPIMVLIFQVIWLFCLLLWLEGGSFSWLSRRNTIVPARDVEKSGPSGRPDVEAEAARVEASDSDLLRMLHVTKRFGSHTAVDNVSLGLKKNEIFALLGPNGAGKTTSISMIRGDLSPTSGSIHLEGIDVHKNTLLAQQHLGVCPQFDALDMLTVREHLAFYARCKGLPDVKATTARAMAQVGIAGHADKMAAKLSGGNKRKLSLAIALLGDPPVLLLDEPSSAMDAASKRALWRTLEAVSPGRSVLLTTHSMEEADALAGRAAIVAGRLLAVGSTRELRRAHSNEYHVHLVLGTAPLSPAEEMRCVADWVGGVFPGVRFEGRNLGGQVRFTVPADSKVPDTGVPAPAPAAEGGERPRARNSQSFVRYLIETLEAHKEPLGVDCYSIGAATMESVFLSVVKESDAVEDEDPRRKRWWRR